MDKIKIVYIIGNLDMGGTERQFIEMIRRLNRDQFECSVLSFRCQGAVRTVVESLGIPFTGLGFGAPKGRFHPDSYVRMYRFIRDMIRHFKGVKPHIVQSYLPWANIVGTFAANVAGVPVIITGRRVLVNEEYMPFPKPDQWLEDLSNLWATAVITNSQVVRQQSLQREKFLTEEKIRVIYNGIDLNRFTCDVDVVRKRKELQIPEDSHVIGILATLHPRKGHRVFLQAAQRILKTYPQSTFLLIGRDEGILPELESLARELQIRDTLIFTGEQHDVPDLLSSLDVQVSASFMEGLSNSIIEGMTMGKPVVATDVGGNSELVVHAHTGLLVPAGNPENLAQAIIHLLTDASLRKQMGAAGRRRIEELFRLERMVAQIETLYQELAPLPSL